LTSRMLFFAKSLSGLTTDSIAGPSPHSAARLSARSPARILRFTVLSCAGWRCRSGAAERCLHLAKIRLPALHSMPTCCRKTCCKACSRHRGRARVLHHAWCQTECTNACVLGSRHRHSTPVRASDYEAEERAACIHRQAEARRAHAAAGRPQQFTQPRQKNQTGFLAVNWNTTGKASLRAQGAPKGCSAISLAIGRLCTRLEPLNELQAVAAVRRAEDPMLSCQQPSPPHYACSA